jgi:hypothetical protein
VVSEIRGLELPLDRAIACDGCCVHDGMGSCAHEARMSRLRTLHIEGAPRRRPETSEVDP